MEKLQYHLEVFDGPLDLLLSLVAKNKLDIYDIPISQLLDQYMEQIDRMREENMDVASEFLEMAARLVQIKAASLLPRQEEEEDALASRCTFDQLTRSPEPIPVDPTYKRLHDPRELAQALAAAWGKGRTLLPPKPENFSALVSRKIVSVASQAVAILRLLWKKKSLSFQELFRTKHDRSQRVAAFLAVLELVKNRRLRVEGEGDASRIQLLDRGKKR